MGRNEVHPAPAPSTERPADHAPSSSRTAPRRPLQRLSEMFSSAMYRIFYGLGSLVCRRPAITVAGCLLLTLLCCLGFFRVRMEERVEYLYTPQNLPSFNDRVFSDLHFPVAPGTLTVYVTAAPETSLLSQEALLAALQIHEAIISAEATVGGQTITFTDTCLKVANKQTQPAWAQCAMSGPLGLWNFNATRIAEDKNISATLLDNLMDEDYMAVKVEDGKVVAAEAFALTYVTVSTEEGVEDVEGSLSKDTLTAWIVEAHNEIAEFPQDVIQASAYSFEYLDTEADRAISEDTYNLSLGYFGLIAFMNISFFRRNPIHDMSFIGMASVAAVALAMGSAYGLAALMGAPFSQAVAMLPFILLGLGVDDSFVIMGEMHAVDPHLTMPVKERISKSLGYAGSAILVTSMTDFCAFISGIGSALPAIQQASLYAALGILFDFFYQVTFFVAALVYRGRAQEARRYFPLVCYPVSEESAESLRCSGRPPKKYDPTAPLPMERLMRNWVTPVILHPVGKAVILLIGVSLTALSCWQVTKAETNFNYEWFAPPDSPINDAFDARDTYFGGRNGLAYIITKQGDYFSPLKRRELLNVGSVAEKNPFVREYNSWFENFKAAVLDPAETRGEDLTASRAAYFSALCNYTDYSAAKYDISWGRGGEKLASCHDRDLTDEEALAQDPPILAARMTLVLVEEDDSASQVAAMEEAKLIAAEVSGFDTVAYAYPFLVIEGFKVFKTETLKNVAIATSCVFAVTLVMLADISSAFLVVLSVLAVDVCLIGFMVVDGLTYNAVTCINIVFAIGIAVDYTMHITHSFLHASGSRQERARHALHHMGPSIANGALSTLIGALATAGSSAYVFRVFFKMFTVITGLGAFFGIAFMPVVLSLVGSRTSMAAAGHSEDPSSVQHSEELSPSQKPAVEVVNSDDDEEERVPAQLLAPL